MTEHPTRYPKPARSLAQLKFELSAFGVLIMGCAATATTATATPVPDGMEAEVMDGGRGDHDANNFSDGGPSEFSFDLGSSISRENQELRLMAPVSTSFVTSRRPTLRWTGPQGVPSSVEICLDRACGRREFLLSIVGGAVVPPTDLDTGVHFWRVTSEEGGRRVSSHTWEFSVPSRSSPIDSAYGNFNDFNGDGFADMVIAEPGQVRVYWGGQEGFGPVEGHAVNPPNGGFSTFGSQVISSDLNGDGYSELIVSAPGSARDPNPPSTVYVYRGSNGGLADSPATTTASPDTLNLFGLLLASLGDYSGDGYPDIAIATTGAYRPNGMGRLHVFRGGPSDFVPLPPPAFPSPIAEQSATILFPHTLSMGGDFDGDGNVDILAGILSGATSFATFFGPLGTHPFSPDHAVGENPASFSIPITVNRMDRCDIDGDGRSDVLVAYRDQIAVFRLDQNRRWTHSVLSLNVESADYGYVLCSSDSNGDGFSDALAIIQTYGTPAEPESDRFRIYSILGGATGLRVSSLRLIESQHRAPIGVATSASSVGDLNGDGYADLVLAERDPVASLGRRYLVKVFRGSRESGYLPQPSQSLIWNGILPVPPSVRF